MDPVSQSTLFPARRILISWGSYKIIPSNIEVIYNFCHEIIGTFEDGDPVKCSTISFGHLYETKLGLRYDIEIYGKDLEELLDHVLRQVQLSYKYHTYGRHHVWFYFPIHFDEKIVRQEIVKRIPVEQQTGGYTASLFERAISLNAKM